jgi:hypothetical protein
MSQEEKSNYISLITTLTISIPYMASVLIRYQDKNMNTEEELKFWAVAILILIPIRIVSEIIMHIIVAIITAIATGKEGSEVVDERDKLIDLKSNRNAYYLTCIGFLLSMIVIVLNQSVSAMFIVLFITGFLAEMVDIFSKMFYYRRGV